MKTIFVFFVFLFSYNISGTEDSLFQKETLSDEQLDSMISIYQPSYWPRPKTISDTIRPYKLQYTLKGVVSGYSILRTIHYSLKKSLGLGGSGSGFSGGPPGLVVIYLLLGVIILILYSIGLFSIIFSGFGGFLYGSTLDAQEHYSTAPKWAIERPYFSGISTGFEVCGWEDPKLNYLATVRLNPSRTGLYADIGVYINDPKKYLLQLNYDAHQFLFNYLNTSQVSFYNTVKLGSRCSIKNGFETAEAELGLSMLIAQRWEINLSGGFSGGLHQNGNHGVVRTRLGCWIK